MPTHIYIIYIIYIYIYIYILGVEKYDKLLINLLINYDLKWFIACKAHPYTGGTRKCDLCLTEKLAIMKADPGSLFNARDEFISKCRHMNKFTLRFFKKK